MIVLEVFRGLEERKKGGIKWVEYGLDKRDDGKLPSRYDNSSKTRIETCKNLPLSEGLCALSL